MPVLCTPEDVADVETVSEIVTRVTDQKPGAATLWTIYQSLGVGAPADANWRARRLLEAGATGLVVAFDRPTRDGLDPDDERASGGVGHDGVSIATVDDMRAVFDGVDLGGVAVSLPGGPTTAMLLALLLVAAEQGGVPWASLAGMSEGDILSAACASEPPAWARVVSLRLSADLTAFCDEHLPGWAAVTVSGYRLREAGATAQAELSYSLAAALVHLKAAVAHGIDVERACRHLSICVSAHDNLFEEVAKLRAARQVWTRLMRESFGIGAGDGLELHVRTLPASLAADDPRDNVTRVACQALAAASGGARSLFTHAFDAVAGHESLDAAVLSVRTQQVLAYESGLAGERDPFGGAWLVERLTRDFVNQAVHDIAELERRGDVSALFEGGLPLPVGHAARQRARGDGRQPGRHDDGAAVRRVTQFGTYRQNRDVGAAAAALAGLRAAVAGSGNTMARFVACARAGVTLGEMTAAVATTVALPTVP